MAAYRCEQVPAVDAQGVSLALFPGSLHSEAVCVCVEQAFVTAYRLVAEANAMCAALQQDVSFTVEARVDPAGVRDAVFAGVTRASSLQVRQRRHCCASTAGMFRF